LISTRVVSKDFIQREVELNIQLLALQDQYRLSFLGCGKVSKEVSENFPIFQLAVDNFDD
jgi:hypothetical protein